MTRVVIQPSFGNAEARRHWADTLDREVDFTSPDAVEALGGDLDALIAAHPAGRARFWGATSVHDPKFAQLSTGDLVLFTGKKIVRGIGEIGTILNNSRFGDNLWQPHPDRGSYQNVYSLRGFQNTAIPYEEIWTIPGFNKGDNFMGLRLLDEEKSRVVMEALGLETATEAAGIAISTAGVLSGGLPSEVVAEERVLVEATTYKTLERSVLVNRAEALLVRQFSSLLEGADQVGRLRTAVGVCDLYIQYADGAELVEAKSDAGHKFVRQALSQLLDYARDAPLDVRTLTALFPTEPKRSGVDLLTMYGIDCAWILDGQVQRRPGTAQGWRR